MKIAVTGASGFIGRHLLNALQGHQVVAMTRQASKLKFVCGVRVVEIAIDQADINFFDALGCPDVLIHLAWSGLPNYQSSHHLNTELPAQQYFLSQLIASGLPKLVVAGTCFEYGLQSGALAASTPTQPYSQYAIAKDQLRQYLQSLQYKQAFALTWARLFYMYGDGQAAHTLYARLKAAVARGDVVFNMSGGEQLRDYLPVEAVARQLASLANGEHGAGVVNVCSGQPIAVRDLLMQWARERGWQIQFNFGYYPYRDNEPMAFWGKED